MHYLYFIKKYLLFTLGFCFFTFYFSKAQDTTTVKADKIVYGIASFYSDKFNGRKTGSGEIFNQTKFTAASNRFSFGTWLKVTNLRNNKTVWVRVNDRMHPKMKRIVDLTRAAAQKIGMINAGIAKVKVEVYGKNKPK